MVKNHTGGDDSESSAFSRRSVIKAAGAVTAASSIGLLSGTSSARSVVDLGEQGLTEGDTIDPYLEEYFVDGNEVLVPPGTYNWDGDGFPGRVGDAALRGDGGVFKLDAGDGWEHTPNVYASSGTVLVENMQVLGEVGGTSNDQSERGRFSFGASSSSAKCVVRNYIQRDGAVADTWGQGIYVGGAHEGELVFDGLDIRGVNNNATYTSGSAKGPVHWRNCYFENNNIASIRMASDGSTVQNCVIVNDGSTDAPAQNQRGIWVREEGENMRIENTDIYYVHTGSGSSYPVQIKPRDSGGSGHIKGLRVRNDNGADAVDRVSGDWSGDTIDVTGDGNLEVPSDFTNVCQGDGCDPARTDVDGTTDDGTSDDGSTDDGDSTTPPNNITIQGSGYTNPVEYTFSVSEVLEKGPEADDADTVEGTTASGVCGGTDDYYFGGEITAFDMTGDGTVYVNGEQVDPSTLGSDSGGSSDGGDSTDDGGDSTDSTSLPNTIVIDGTRTKNVSEYTFSVSGEVERDESLSMVEDGGLPWDTMKDRTGDSTVVGIVGDAKDAYRFSGEITSIDIRGSAKVKIQDGN